MPEFYEIKIKGCLDGIWSDWLSKMQITQLPENETLISGQVEDQAMLHGLLERIRDLNLELLSITRVDKDINEEI